MTRHALMLFALFSVTATAAPSAESPPDYLVRYEGIRRAYLRGETARLEFRVVNTSTGTLDNATLSLDIGGLIRQQAQLAPIPPASSAARVFRIDTRVLKEGQYSVTCVLEQANRTLGKATFAMCVARNTNPDRMPLWLWPCTSYTMKEGKLNDEAERQLNWYADKGVNAFTLFGEFNEDYFQTLDHFLRQGWHSSFFGTGLMGSKDDTDPALKYNARDSRGKLLDPFHPEVANIQNELNRTTMQILRHFPQVKFCFLDTEIADYIYGGQTPYSKHYAADYSPATVKHEFLAPGVIADNDEEYVRWTKR